jgi:NAD(P)-dependent dehydrogenase (short-subunit alcohol dehydrogenase family)
MAATEPWSADDLPDLTGRTFVVTGANSGLGFEASLALVRRGARVVMACRDPARAQAALEEIRARAPEGGVETMELDLADLASVRRFADAFLARHDALHGLCNNAGVMALPFCKTTDGFEMQFGTNHLGHFALTGLLLERLLGTPGARVVNQSSTAHKVGRLDFDDLHWQRRRYSKWRAYGQSKLSNLLFTYELQRRLEARRAPVIAAACHPGYAATNLQTAGPRMLGSRLRERGMDLANRLFSQTAEMGALPLVYAAAAPGVRGSDYIGPGGFAESRGYPTKVRSSRRSYDTGAAGRLWEASEKLTGVPYEPLR